MPNQPGTSSRIISLNRHPLSRRAFLLGISVSMAGAALAACGPRTARPEPMASAASPPLRVLPNARAAVAPAAASEAGALATFLALSALLTGVSLLDPGLGSLYLAHWQATNASGLTALYEQAGFTSETPPATLQALEGTGIFDNESMQQVADQIITLWYTGKYQNAEGEAVVVTFVDALAWKILDFTKPPTICGSPGFWAFHPTTTTVRS